MLHVPLHRTYPFIRVMALHPHHGPSSSVHVIPLLLLLELFHHHLLPLSQILAIQRTRALQLQPRRNTLEIESMLAMTRQDHDEGVLVVQEGLRADRAHVILLQRLLLHALQAVEEVVRHALDLVRRVLRLAVDGAEHALEQLAGLRRCHIRAQLVERFAIQPVCGFQVAGRGQGVSVRGVARVGRYLRELVEERAHVRTVTARRLLVLLDIVLD
jgi:hypothetical protein